MPDSKTDKQDTEPKAEKPVWEFVGSRLADGRPAQFVMGVPAEDLTQADIDALTDDQRKQATASGLYRDAAKKAS